MGKPEINIQAKKKKSSVFINALSWLKQNYSSLHNSIRRASGMMDLLVILRSVRAPMLQLIYVSFPILDDEEAHCNNALLKDFRKMLI